MSDTRLSFVVPARNEEALIGETMEAILASIARSSGVARHDLWLPETSFEVIVADDESRDATPAIVSTFTRDAGVRLIRCAGGTCAAARNAGAAASAGRVLCFVDADTIVPDGSVDRILELHEGEGRCLVLYRLASREPGIRAWLWWTLWGLARRLPLSRAKSMPALMSCTRSHFERYGPFEASWAIAEEWPLTRAAYRLHRKHFLYDRRLTARTSSRRMELQPLGYLRTLVKWVAVVLAARARAAEGYKRIRHETRNGELVRDRRWSRTVLEAAERAYFLLCLALARLLRSARYTKTRIVDDGGERHVRKHRSFYAPVLVWLADPLLRILNTGVRVLRQRDWEERERQIYRRLYGASVRVTDDGALLLPQLAGDTLATLLEDPKLEESVRRNAIGLAAVALADFHGLGLTHGDAMAGNVVVDIAAATARWIDFETLHDSGRPLAWRRADDLRALLLTSLARSVPEKHVETVDLILNSYVSDEVTRGLAASFSSVWRRSLAFHLAQAELSFPCFRRIGGLLQQR